MQKVQNNVLYELIIEQLRSEYVKEKQTSDAMDNKCGMLLAALGILITILFEQLPFSILTKSMDDTYVFYILLGIIIFSMLSTILCIIRALQIRDYNSINISALIDKGCNVKDINKYYQGVMKHYEYIILENGKLNQRKAKQIRLAMYAFSLFLIISIVSIIGIKIYL